jgi:glycerol-3-phosphate dehydrogenase
MVDLVMKRLGTGRTGRGSPCTTGIKPLPGGLSGSADEILKKIEPLNGCGLTMEQIRHLARRYGSRAQDVIALIQRDGNLKQPLVPGMPDIWAQAVYSTLSEMAVHPEDILMRRTQIGVKDPIEAAQVIELLRKTLNLPPGGTAKCS